MKISEILLLVFLCLFSCKKNETVTNNDKGTNTAACGVSNPVQEIPWLRDLVREMKNNREDNYTTIKLLEFNGKPVINYYVSYWSCYGCVNYYCDGTKLDMSKFSQAETKEFYANLSDTTGKTIVIWPQ
ncbi:hypothetical protein [Dyadobacter frigoris]|uniref:Uncharacterized protein n=1 Tax=Dyadobacter frigoris TaxID=2576211 RepID=A0A4U6D5X1_9BACT|nr:hypothetical protein [Dyadobacter frigoris]TKT91458.1 hypothetical protein FDK13_13885 [Dyadobacter frigoris]GLU51986.1 hypothetical protein Dfri01_14470 [Dyadobacter frigoris]